MDELLALKTLRWPDVKWDRWDPKTKPIAIVDGKLIPLLRLQSRTEGAAAYVVGVNDKSFSQLCDHLRVEALHFYEMRVTDLTPLLRLSGLRRLAVRWNTKLTSLDALRELPLLEVLVLEHTPKVRDLSPLDTLRRLRSLEFSGGIWSKNTATSLEPVGGLPALQELVLHNLKIESGGLRPLARCKSLQRLDVSNQFPTSDYAYLSVHLPQTDCESFTGSVPLGQPVGGKNTMVVGHRKPFLCSRRDQERLERYSREFSRLQERFRAQARSGGD